MKGLQGFFLLKARLVDLQEGRGAWFVGFSVLGLSPRALYKLETFRALSPTLLTLTQKALDQKSLKP